MERRIHLMVLVVLDTGMRVDEVSHIRKKDVDMDNLLLAVHKGKGGKQRVVPFSLALRRALFRFMKTEPHPISEFVFSTRSGLPQTYRNAHRQLKLIGTKVGAPAVRFHLLRHQWATHYLRSGGSVALLRRQLGHASLDTVLFYEHLASCDLSKYRGHCPFLGRVRGFRLVRRGDSLRFTTDGKFIERIEGPFRRPHAELKIANQTIESLFR